MANIIFFWCRDHTNQFSWVVYGTCLKIDLSKHDEEGSHEVYISTPRRAFCVCRPSSEITLDNEQGSHGASSVHMTKHFYDVHLRHHLILRHVMVRHIIVLMCHVCGIYVFVSSCKCYSRLVNVCHGFVPSCFCYFCHSNVFHAHACHAIVCHAIVTSCKCLSCKRDHVNERHTSASSRVPRWLPYFLGRGIGHGWALP